MADMSQLDRIEAKLDTILNHFKLVFKTKEDIEAEHRTEIANQYHHKIVSYIQSRQSAKIFDVLYFTVNGDVCFENEGIYLDPGDYVIYFEFNQFLRNPIYYVINKESREKKVINTIGSFISDLGFLVYDHKIKINGEVLK